MSHKGKISQTEWEDYYPSIVRLVELPIIHPSIDRSLSHRAVLVLNGEISEEVRREIDDKNADWLRRGYPKLEVLVRWQLLKGFEEIHTAFWPVQLVTEKTLLEFFLLEGTECLKKAELAEFLLTLLPIFDEEVSATDCGRAISSAAIICSYALAPFTERENLVAVIEGWMVFIACLVCLVEKKNLRNQYWKESFDIALLAIDVELENLVGELQTRNVFAEGNILLEFAFYRPRMTWLMSLIALRALWKKWSQPDWIIEDWYKAFIKNHLSEIDIWGEGAIPQYLAIVWFMRQIVPTTEPDEMLAQIVGLISNVNNNQHSKGLADPYHSLEEVVAETYDLIPAYKKETYKGRSYTLLGLIHLYSRRNWRQRMRLFWRSLTYIECAEFRVDAAWQFCMWHCENYGALHLSHPQNTQSWSKLRQEAAEVDTSLIPPIMQENPPLLLLFAITYPHRMTTNCAKFLDNHFMKRL